MTTDEMQQKLVELLGSTGAGISVGMLQSAIDVALDDLARFRPKVSYVAVNLVPGQTQYNVPAGTYNVLEAVFPEWNELADLDMDAYDARYGVGTIGDGDLSTFHSGSLAVILAQKWEQFENRYTYDWEYDIDAGKVLVIPAPKSASMMVLKVAYARTMEEVPQSLLVPVQELALAESLRALAMTTGGGITSVPIGIG